MQQGQVITHKGPALVLAAFGTTIKKALPDLLNIRKAMIAAFPDIPVRLAFTSNQVRHIWHQRAADPDYRASIAQDDNRQGIEDILTVQGILATIANLQDSGHKQIIVQSLHIVPAEEFHDLAAYIQALTSIRTMKPRWQPFDKIALGRPLLGSYNPQRPYARDIAASAQAVQNDINLARQQKAALVYMGHGNPYFPSGGLYMEFAACMRQLYPDVLTCIGTVEGFPGIEDIRREIQQCGIKKILLKPFLLIAGEHAVRDLAGEQEHSWYSIFSNMGLEVKTDLQGLASLPTIVCLFVEHARQAAADSGIEWN